MFLNSYGRRPRATALIRETVTEECRFGNESGEHPDGARRFVRYATRYRLTDTVTRYSPTLSGK